MNRKLSRSILAAALLAAISSAALAAGSCQSEATTTVGIDPVNSIAYVPLLQGDASGNARIALVSMAGGANPAVGQTMSLPGAGGIVGITYNPLNQTMLVAALLSGTNSINIYVIDTTARSLTAGSPIGTTLVINSLYPVGGIVMDTVHNRAIIAGDTQIGILDTSTTPNTFQPVSTVNNFTDLFTMTLNQSNGTLYLSGSSSNWVVDTTQPLPWTVVGFGPSGYVSTIQNTAAFDPTTNIVIDSPTGYNDVTEAINFNTYSHPANSAATANFIMIGGLGDPINTIGGGPGGWVAVNCVTHQSTVVDIGGENIKLIQMPANPVAGALDNNGQPYTATTADPASAYTISSTTIAKSSCGNQPITTAAQPVLAIDQQNNQLYVSSHIGAVNSVQYLDRVDLSSPVAGGCPANSFKYTDDTGAPCTLGPWNPTQAQILLPGPEDCTSFTTYAGNNQSAALGASYRMLQARALTAQGTVASGVSVTFSVSPTGAGGTFGGATSATVSTDMNGLATAPLLTANTTPGGFTVAATASGYSTPAYFSLTNLPPTVMVTFQTSPPGLLVNVDGTGGQATPFTQLLLVGSVHTVTTTSPQTMNSIRYVWQSWSDGQTQSHSIVVPGTTTYTATFAPSYPLTISASPSNEGLVTPTSGNYYASGTAVPITATPLSGYVFTGWTGSVANPTSASTTVTMSGPETVVANFGVSTTFSISPTSIDVTATAGNGTVMVTAPSGSATWTAVSNSSFLTITSGSSGAGNGTVGFSVAANTGGVRTGTLTIAGLTFTVNQVAGALTGLGFYPVTPCRVADTRTGQGFSGQFGPPSLAAGQIRNIAIPSSGCNIPSTAEAFSLNITVVPRTVLGYLTIWPTGQSQPLVSTLNSQNGATLANAAIVPAGVGGQVSVFVTDTIDLIIDINGYFAAPSSSSLAFYPVTPCRVADTRSGSGQFGAPSLPASGIRSFIVPQSNCGIPATAQAYSLNMTVVPPAPLIYLTTWPTGSPQPVVSTLNALQGQIAANAAIVPAGTNGAISVFVSNASNVIIDINGYFAPPGSPGALNFYPVTPCRVADTRTATGNFGGPSLPAGGTRTFPVPTSNCGLPSTAQAYSFNMTVVPAGPLLYLTTWPAGLPQPVVSTLNDQQGLIVANAAIVPAGTSPAGGVSVFVSDASNVIIDVNGYFGQ